MDLLVCYLLQLAILCISLPLVFHIYKHKSSSTKLPPGSKGWPVVGEGLAYAMATKSGDPAKFITDRMSMYSPDMFRTSLLGENVAVFCGVSGNKFLFSSENKYVSTWWPRAVPQIMHFNSDQKSFDNEETSEQRAAVVEFCKPEALRRYMSFMDTMAKEHLQRDWSPYKEVNVFPLTKKYIFALFCQLFINCKDSEQYLTRWESSFRVMSAGIVSLPINLPSTAFSRAVKAGKFIHEELLEIIRH
ncbi:Beta-amyrin 28-oxidase [Morella rubra]|uniref:Beta-amyrin 28-oxidase n=1 Tax=Morella rubra TaxID=262757 RepID=A0A6A1VTZ1_9ROSI|nr:Beta-amyrin 28-oxidase [Morella rubra]